MYVLQNPCPHLFFILFSLIYFLLLSCKSVGHGRNLNVSFTSVPLPQNQTIVYPFQVEECFFFFLKFPLEISGLQSLTLIFRNHFICIFMLHSVFFFLFNFVCVLMIKIYFIFIHNFRIQVFMLESEDLREIASAKNSLKAYFGICIVLHI